MLKRECIRPQTPLNVADARRIVGRYVSEYTDVHLHSGIGYVAPRDRLDGRDQAIWEERHRKLTEARLTRRAPPQTGAALVASQPGRCGPFRHYLNGMRRNSISR